jgi:ketosteroid isomerase-like protein
MTSAATIEEITPALQRWQQGIGARDLELIGTAFTRDALFQGSRPAPLFGPEGAREYYGSQPVPLTVDYEIIRFRPLGTAAATAYLKATFHPGGREDLATYITLILEPVEGEWLIGHYHVSFIA